MPTINLHTLPSFLSLWWFTSVFLSRVFDFIRFVLIDTISRYLDFTLDQQLKAYTKRYYSVQLFSSPVDSKTRAAEEACIYIDPRCSTLNVQGSDTR